MTALLQPRNGLITRQRPGKRKRTNDLIIGTWNVLTLNRAGALRTLSNELTELKLDIIALQETKWLGVNVLKTNGYVLYYSGKNTGNRSFGTGFLVNLKRNSQILEFKAINERICSLRVKSKFYNIYMICVHAPTEDKEEEEKEHFYHLLEEVYTNAPDHDMKIVIGDLNAKVGRESLYEPTIGKHSLHHHSNNNGCKLIQFAVAKNMKIMGTYFPHKDIHKATWRAPGGRTQNQIDHVIADARHASSILDVRTCRGPNIDSDHYLVKVVVRARISKGKSLRGGDRKRYNLEKLKDRDTKLRYQNKLEEVFSQHDNTNSTSETWKGIAAGIHSAAEDVLGIQQRQRRNYWYDDECKRATEVKNIARLKMLQNNTRANKEIYKKERTEERKIIRKKKRELEREAIEAIENYNELKETRKMYKVVDRLRSGYKPRPFICKNTEGEIITKEEDCIDIWANYFDELLNRNSTNEMEGNVVSFDVQPEQLAPSFEEVETAILQLKNNKSPGTDDIPGELIKNGGDLLVSKLHMLIENIWDTEVMPEEWNDGIICPIYKNGDKLKCSNYRPITLLNIAYKVFAKILFTRIKPYVDNQLGEYQCGFRNDRSTTDQLFSIRQILEKCYEHNVDTHHLFIDFKSAYDSVTRSYIWMAMRDFGIPLKLINATKLTLANVRNRVCVGGKLSAYFTTMNGLRQGDPLATLLFNIVLDKVVKDSKIEVGKTIYTKSSQILAFADDIDIIGRNKNVVIEICRTLTEKAAPAGLKINEGKTKYMLASKSHTPEAAQLQVNEYSFEVVEQFKYLGADVNCKNDVTDEIKKRITQANRCYYSVSKIIRSTVVSRKLKCTLYKTLIRPVVMYGSETWCLTKSNENILLIFERKILRRIFGPIADIHGNWRIRYNAELYQLFQEPDLVKIIKIGQLRWLGHVHRQKEQRIPRSLMYGKPEGRRSQGRPRIRWLDGVERSLSQMDVRNWKEKALDRSEWGRILKQAQTHIGLSS